MDLAHLPAPFALIEWYSNYKYLSTVFFLWLDRMRSMSQRTVDWLPPAGAFDEPLRNNGLRQRKKHLLRQQLSDTATEMFLDRGFNNLRIADVAAACDVSEKTVY